MAATMMPSEPFNMSKSTSISMHSHRDAIPTRTFAAGPARQAAATLDQR
jgi:hypothetical protein